MNELPLISVIVPVYNVQKYIVCCVKSIQSQTYRNLEILLVDDGSSDRSPEICDELASVDSRIKVLHKENGGSADARNAGLEQAQGKYLIFVDGDDYIHPEMLSKLYHDLCEKQADMAMCGFVCVGEDDEQTEICLLNRGDHIRSNSVITADDFWMEYYTRPDVAHVAVWNKLVPARIYSTIRFKKGRKIDDEFVIHQVLAQCNKIACLQENWYCYRKRSGSAMSSSFSIGRLDVVEARTERAVFFLQNGNQFFAEKSLTYAISDLIDGKGRLSRDEPSAKARYRQLRKECQRIGWRVFCRRSSLRFKLAFLLFNLGDSCYASIIRKRRKNR